jgi:hypothetical protein
VCCPNRAGASDAGIADGPERERIRKIAGWKAEAPRYISTLPDKLRRPLVVAIDRIVPPGNIAVAQAESNGNA